MDIPSQHQAKQSKQLETLITQQAAVIEQMREALESFDGLFDYTGNAEKRRRQALAFHANQDALHEERARECERLASRVSDSEWNHWVKTWLLKEADEHRARKSLA